MRLPSINLTGIGSCGRSDKKSARSADGRTDTAPVICRIDTAEELDYYRNGGILHYVLRNMLNLL